jgi:hypothetical protein
MTDENITLEDLTPNARVHGVLPTGPVTVVQVEWHGTEAITLTYRDETGRVDHQLLYRASEKSLRVEAAGRAWSFDADGKLFRLVSEALRIQLAHLFDPYLAVHTSNIDPLPHQIRAVYEELLPRQPLRFLLADDPGAGKTIMAGLFVKELIVRGDLARCMVVAPGSLVEQWQDELGDKLGLEFEIITRESIDASRSGCSLGGAGAVRAMNWSSWARTVTASCRRRLCFDGTSTRRWPRPGSSGKGQPKRSEPSTASGTPSPNVRSKAARRLPGSPAT